MRLVPYQSLRWNRSSTQANVIKKLSEHPWWRFDAVEGGMSGFGDSLPKNHCSWHGRLGPVNGRRGISRNVLGGTNLLARECDRGPRCRSFAQSEPSW